VQIRLSSDHMSYPLNLMANQTYTIKVYASNSIGQGPAEMITWPLPGEYALKGKIPVCIDYEPFISKSGILQI